MIVGTQPSRWRETKVKKKIEHCIDGLRSAWKECSFRYVTLYTLCNLLATWAWAPSLCWKGFVFFAATFPSCIELINSSVERANDRIGIQYHILTKESKDMAGASSMLAQLLALIATTHVAFSGFLQYYNSNLTFAQYLLYTLTV
jgi:diacylglycerol kinase (ATP)